MDNQETTFQQRVEIEKKELDVKIAALRGFLSSKKTETFVKPEDLALLKKQLTIMDQYSLVLGERLVRFDM